MNLRFEEQLHEAASGPDVGFTADDVAIRVRRRTRRNRRAFATATVVLVLTVAFAVLARNDDAPAPEVADHPDDGLTERWHDELTGDRWVVTAFAAVTVADQNPWYDFAPDGTFVAFDGCDSHEGRWSLDPQDDHHATFTVEVTAKVQRSPCQGTSSDLHLPTDVEVDDAVTPPVVLDPMLIWREEGTLGIDVPGLAGGRVSWGMQRFDRLGSVIDASRLSESPVAGEGDLFGSGVDGYLQLQPGRHLTISTTSGCRHSASWTQEGDRYDLFAPLTLADACGELADHLDQDHVRIREDDAWLWVMTDRSVVPMLRWGPEMSEVLPDDSETSAPPPDDRAVDPTASTD